MSLPLSSNLSRCPLHDMPYSLGTMKITPSQTLPKGDWNWLMPISHIDREILDRGNVTCFGVCQIDHLWHNLVSSQSWLFWVGLGYREKRVHAWLYLAPTMEPLLLVRDQLGHRLFLSMTFNVVLSNLTPPGADPHLDYGCLRMNLASGMVKQNRLLRLYFKPNSVSCSLVIWFIWPLGASTESAEMPYWHFTSDLQPPTLKACFLSDRRFSPIQSQTVAQWLPCWIILCLNGSGRGSRGVSIEKEPKLCPHTLGKEKS